MGTLRTKIPKSFFIYLRTTSTTNVTLATHLVSQPPLSCFSLSFFSFSPFFLRFSLTFGLVVFSFLMTIFSFNVVQPIHVFFRIIKLHLLRVDHKKSPNQNQELKMLLKYLLENTKDPQAWLKLFALFHLQ